MKLAVNVCHQRRVWGIHFSKNVILASIQGADMKMAVAQAFERKVSIEASH